MRRPRAPRLDRGRSHPPRRRLPPDAPRRHAHRPATHRPNRRADHQAPRPGRRRPPENLSGHSLRAGYATAAAAAGIEERKIANVTRHKNLPRSSLCGSGARGSADMTVSCPRCGGIQVRPIAPGLYECQTTVQVGWREDPPAMTGAGFQRHPVHGPCGNRFQVPAPSQLRPGGFQAAAGTRSGHARGAASAVSVVSTGTRALRLSVPLSREARRGAGAGEGRQEADAAQEALNQIDDEIERLIVAVTMTCRRHSCGYGVNNPDDAEEALVERAVLPLRFSSGRSGPRWTGDARAFR